jgi:hypothetical protein
VLEKLVDLKLYYYDGELEIEGKVSVPEAVDGSDSNRKNCNTSLGADAESQRQDRHGSETGGPS